MFSFDSQCPLPVPGAGPYRGLAFDGCRYYLTALCACRISVLTCDFCPETEIQTCRPYSAICYDPKRGCFWALSDQNRFTLFQLNLCLQEIDRFLPCVPGGWPGPLTGISFCCEDNRLLAGSGNTLLELDPDSKTAHPVLKERGNMLILAVACLPPYILLSTLCGCTAYFVLTSRDGIILAKEPSRTALETTALLLNPCGCAPDAGDLILLTHQHGCRPRLLRARLDAEISGTLCPCNRALCRACTKPRPDHTPNACADILESVAMMEAALAHILNAEGEKLQAVLAQPAASSELLLVDQSVQTMILSILLLEQVLLSKLETLRELCSFCEPGPPPPCCAE